MYYDPDEEDFERYIGAVPATDPAVTTAALLGDDDDDDDDFDNNDFAIDDEDGRPVATDLLCEYVTIFAHPDAPLYKYYEPEDEGELLDFTDIIQPLMELPPVPTPNVAAASRPAPVDGDVTLRSSPPVRFMREHVAVRIDLDQPLPKLQLVALLHGDARITALVPAEAVYVGRKGREPHPSAVICVEDTDDCHRILLDSVPHLVPNARVSLTSGTDDPIEMRPFFREEKIKEKKADVPVALPTTRKPRKWNIGRDIALMHELITAAGGIHMVKLGCIDIEAAHVLKGPIPLPVEIAVYSPVQGLDYNTFIHPGFVRNDNLAMKLSTCLTSGGHGIPFRECKFLRKDYDQLAREMDENVVQKVAEGTLFINRGFLVDINAIRWVYAAAHATRGECGDIPPIYIFEIDTLKEYLMGKPEGAAVAAAPRDDGEDGGGLDEEDEDVVASPTSPESAAAAAPPALRIMQSTRPGDPCPYHAEVTSLGIGLHGAHCGRQDAVALMAQVDELMEQFRATCPSRDADGLPIPAYVLAHLADPATTAAASTAAVAGDADE